MKKPPIDVGKLRKGDEVKCPECKRGILRTNSNPMTAHCFKCDVCGMRINFD